jgi:hypothetical protein
MLIIQLFEDEFCQICVVFRQLLGYFDEKHSF